MKLIDYVRIWLASARYSVVRTMMFRVDFLMWALVESMWMGVNLLLVSVIYAHTDSVAGWSKYEMLLLVGSSMLVQRLTMGFFWTNLFEMARNIRSGHFDFFLAQPGNPLFMVSTRKLDLDSIANAFVAVGLIIYSTHQLGLSPSLFQIALYAGMIAAGLAINFGLLLLVTSLTFWIGASQGIEGSYFTMMEFSRLPRQVFRGFANVLFVWLLPAVVVGNVPARLFLHGFEPLQLLWLVAVALVWFSLGSWVFSRGLRRYASASS
jgi:ABC-2 type transport system permease protein